MLTVNSCRCMSFCIYIWSPRASKNDHKFICLVTQVLEISEAGPSQSHGTAVSLERRIRNLDLQVKGALYFPVANVERAYWCSC